MSTFALILHTFFGSQIHINWKQISKLNLINVENIIKIIKEDMFKLFSC